VRGLESCHDLGLLLNFETVSDARPHRGFLSFGHYSYKKSMKNREARRYHIAVGQASVAGRRTGMTANRYQSSILTPAAFISSIALSVTSGVIPLLKLLTRVTSYPSSRACMTVACTQ